MKKRIFKWTGIVSALLIIILGICFFPLNNYVEGPGSADRLAKYITIDRESNRYNKNSFYMTSVSVSKGTPLINLFAMLNSYYEIVSKNAVVGNQSDQEYEKVQKIYMDSAENSAKLVAYGALGKNVTVQNRGIYVLDVMNKSNFYRRLKPGDVLKKVNGDTIDNSEGALALLKDVKLNKSLTLTVMCKNRTFQLSGKSVHLQAGRNGIGISLVDNQKVTTNPKVSINAHGVGGPSAGLMYALQIYSELNSKFKLRENVAGTGTIDSQGDVGEIGGIDKKLITANQRGIKIFLTPYIKETKAVKEVEPDHLTNYGLAKKR